MTDIKQTYHRILRERKLSLTAVSPYADALVDAIDDVLTKELAQVASNWQSHVRLDKRVSKLEREDCA